MNKYFKTINLIAFLNVVNLNSYAETNNVYKPISPLHLNKYEIHKLAEKMSITASKNHYAFTGLKTKKMAVCTDFVKRIVNIKDIKRPYFVIGSDPVSLDWLKIYRNKLVSMKAIGLIVQMKSEKSFKKIEALADGMNIYPANGDELSKAYQINCYPVLITKKYIEQ